MAGFVSRHFPALHRWRGTATRAEGVDIVKTSCYLFGVPETVVIDKNFFNFAIVWNDVNGDVLCELQHSPYRCRRLESQSKLILFTNFLRFVFCSGLVVMPAIVNSVLVCCIVIFPLFSCAAVRNVCLCSQAQWRFVALSSVCGVSLSNIRSMTLRMSAISLQTSSWWMTLEFSALSVWMA